MQTIEDLISVTEVLPVTLKQLKRNLSMGGYHDDAAVIEMAFEAIDNIENAHNLCILDQQWSQSMPSLHPANWGAWIAAYPQLSVLQNIGFRGAMIPLKHYPVRSLQSIQYYDASNTLQTFATSNFLFYQDQRYHSYVQLKADVSPPDTYARWDAFKITYNCGFQSTLNSDGSVTTTLPPGLRRYICGAVNTIDNQRSGEVIGTVVNQVHFNLDRLIRPYIGAAI